MKENSTYVQQGFRLLHPIILDYLYKRHTESPQKRLRENANKIVKENVKDGSPALEKLSELSDKEFFDALEISDCLRIIERRYKDIFGEYEQQCSAWARTLITKRNEMSHLDRRDMSQENSEYALSTMEQLCRKMDDDVAKEIHGLYELVRAKETSRLIVPRSDTITPLGNFKGRADDLDKIDSLLRNERTAALSGMAGIGKTYLSREYAYKHRDDYNYIQTVTFGGTIQSFQDLIASVRFDGVDDKEWSDAERYERKHRYFEALDETTLLILDNVDTPFPDMESFREFRSKTRIHILITTRLVDTFDPAVTISVKAMEEDESLDLLSYYLCRPFDDGEEKDARALVHYVEGHTLIIEILAKYIDRGALTCGEMLEYLYAGQDPDISVVVRKDSQSIQGKSSRILQMMLFEGGTKLSDNERNALLLLTLLPTEGVSRRLIFKLLPDERDNINMLTRKSWAQEMQNNQTIRLHPYIREVIQQELNPTLSKCRKLLNNLAALSADNAAVTRAYEKDICKLTRECATNLSSWDGFCDTDLDNFLTLVHYCWNSYEYRSALDVCKVITGVAEDSKKQLLCRRSMAELHTITGDLHRRLAVKSYDKAIAEFKRALDYQAGDRIATGKGYRKLGEVYRKDSRYEDALKYDKLALNYLTDDVDIAEAKNAIGVVYLNIGKSVDDAKEKEEYYKKAMEYYQMALAIRENIPERSGDLAYSYHNIGTVYRDMGNPQKALEYHEKALNIRKKNSLPETDIAASCVWIGNDYVGLGDYSKAEEMIKESLEIRERLLGKDHPDYAWSLDSLASLYADTNRPQEAYKLMQQVVDIRNSALGGSHEYTRQAVKKLEKLKNMCNARKIGT